MRRLLVIAALVAAPHSPSRPRRRPRRTSATASRCACPSAGPWVLATHGPGRSSSSPARSGSSSAASTRSSRSRALDVGFVGGAREPGQPGHHDVDGGRLPRPARARPRPARRASGRTSAAFRRRAAGSAHRRRTTRFTPGKPTVRRVTQLAVRPGTHAPRRRACARGERLVARDARGRLLQRRRRRPGRSRSAVHVVQQTVHAGRVRLTIRGGRARSPASARSSSSTSSARRRMSFGHPLLLLTLLVHPARVLALYRLVERRRMRYAVRYTNVDVLAARRRARPPVAALARDRRLPRSRSRRSASRVVAAARHIGLVASDKATVILVLDVSGSMQATT